MGKAESIQLVHAEPSPHPLQPLPLVGQQGQEGGRHSNLFRSPAAELNKRNILKIMREVVNVKTEKFKILNYFQIMFKTLLWSTSSGSYASLHINLSSVAELKLFIFCSDSGSTFGSGSSSCHILTLKTVLLKQYLVLHIRNMSQWRFFFILVSSKLYNCLF